MRFGDLENGDQFCYNCFRWRKDTELRQKINRPGSKFKGMFMNAKNLSDYGHNAYFEDHVEVEPITKEEEK